jgi:hypothetical protein
MPYVFNQRNRVFSWSKIASIAILALVGSVVAPMQAANATTISCTGGDYVIVAGEADDGSECSGVIQIPEDTTSIGNGAFSGSDITSINIPSTVTSIGVGAFDGARDLTSVTFSPNSNLVEIDDEAFYSATSLASIVIPASVKYIGEYAFENTQALATVTFAPGSQLEEIGRGAFYAAGSLVSISIPSGVSAIEDSTFSHAGLLESVSLPDNLTTIGAYAFYQAEALTSISIPSGVTSIGARAFQNATNLSSFYFGGNAPTVASINAFTSVKPHAKAFIEPNATGFGNLNTSVEIYWNNLIVRPNPPYESSSLYSKWETPLPETPNGPTPGQTVYASAFERPLDRNLYKTGSDNDVVDFRTGTDLQNNYVYPTLEEYVYRITTEPNIAASSVDRQSYGDYEILTDSEQEQWYTDMGISYRFSWRAFMCVEENLDVSANVVRTLTKPTSLSVSYASREDGVNSNFGNPYNYLFRDLTQDVVATTSPSTRTVVGSYTIQTPYPYLGGPDILYAYDHSFGVLDVNSNCGVGKTLEALEIVELNQDQINFDPIISKSFDIPESLKLTMGNEYFDVNATGVTIGVTGFATAPYQAALWGLTTITSANPPSGGGNAAVASSNPPSVQPVSKTRSTTIAGFAGDSSKAPVSMRQRISRMFSGFKKVASAECTGYTSGRAPSRWDTLLANRRAKVACDLVKKSHPSAKVKVVERPAVGVGAKFRSVRIKIVGF